MGLVAPAIIGGVAQLGGAAMGGKAANKAAKLQAQGADKALAFEREQEANRQKEYQQQVQFKKMQWDAYQQARVAALRRYGVEVPDYVPQALPTLGGTPGGPPGSVPNGPGMAVRSPVTLGSIAGRPMGVSATPPRMAMGGPQAALVPPQGPQGPQGPWDARAQTLAELMRQG